MPLSFEANAERVVVLPFDFSEPAANAMAMARAMVQDAKQLYVVHVTPPLETASPAFLNAAFDLQAMRARVEEQLTKAAEDGGASGASTRVRVGDPATEIIAVAREVDAHVIVIPSLGKSGVRRWMLGSVAERVVRHARCPVLVLPIRTDDDEA